MALARELIIGSREKKSQQHPMRVFLFLFRSEKEKLQKWTLTFSKILVLQFEQMCFICEP